MEVGKSFDNFMSTLSEDYPGHKPDWKGCSRSLSER